MDAQKYELDSSDNFMQSDFFKATLDDFNNPANLMSAGYVYPLILTEFFACD